MSQQKSFLGLAKRSFAFWFGGIWFFVGAPFLIAGIYIGVDTIREERQIGARPGASPFSLPKGRISKLILAAVVPDKERGESIPSVPDIA